ncbi:MAG: hypothetical protein ACOYXC_04700 [Candidatus Rifleibacteriota bacterium]
MKRVKFTPVNNQRLLQVFARYRGPDPEPEPIEEPLSSEEEVAALLQESIPELPKARRMVFSTGRRLFMPAQVKEIKIRFVLNPTQR